jgi:hypothetical protein
MYEHIFQHYVTFLQNGTIPIGIPVDSTGIKFQESQPRSGIPIYIPVKIYWDMAGF